MSESTTRTDQRRPQAAIVCGLPGVGKTTVAEHVAQRLDAELVRTDVVRKELRPDPEYTAEETRRVYDELLGRARRSLAAGKSVVLDGTFHEADNRRRARDLANRLGADFTLLRVECDSAVVRDRIEARTGDASDADFAVHEEIRELFDPVSLDHVTVDNTHELGRTARQIEQHIWASMEGTAREGNFVETFTGGRFYPFDPSPDEVRLADIAGGLAHTCRFGGHCRRFYSVALHSLHVSAELSDRGPRLELYGLLHDAGEAYLGDVPRPIKAEFEGLERAEERVLAAVWEAFDVPPPTDEEWKTVMAADDRLLAYEAGTLLADGSWADDPPDLDYDLGADSGSAVRDRFTERAETLLADV